MRSYTLYILTLTFLHLLLAIPGKSQSSFFITREQDLFGVKDLKKNWVIEPIYKEIQEPLPNTFAVLNPKGLWGFFTAEKKITDCIFNNFKFISNDRIIAQKNSRWGLINAEGIELIPFHYRYINPLLNNTYKLGQYNQWTIRTFSNEILFTLAFDSITYVGENLYKFCIAGTYGLCDQMGNIITTQNQDIFETSLFNKLPKKEFATAKENTPKGSFIIPHEEIFDTVYHFSEGLAKFKQFGRYGFVDSTGNIRLVPQYTEAGNFSEGMVAIKLMGKWGFMDIHENLVIQPNFDTVYDFKNGVALVRREGKFNFINKKNKFLYDEYFDSITPTYSGKYILYRNNQFGMANEKGFEFVSTKYEFVDELGNGFIIAREHHLWGFLNNQGDMVIPFNFTLVQFDPEHNRIIAMEPGIETSVTLK